MNKPEVISFFDQATYTVTHVVVDPQSKACAVVDPVLDYEPDSSRTDTHSSDKVIDYIQSNELALEWILESHVHADHLTSAPYLKEKQGGQIAIGSEVKVVQETFGNAFNIQDDLDSDGGDFDRLFVDGDTFNVGSIQAQAIHTPGRDEYQWETTVAEERNNNIHVGSSVSKEEFVAMRTGRDAQLGLPRLICPLFR